VDHFIPGFRGIAYNQKLNKSRHTAKRGFREKLTHAASATLEMLEDRVLLSSIGTTGTPPNLIASPLGDFGSPSGGIPQQAPTAANAGDPVRVDDGTLNYSFTDLTANGFGSSFGQTRSWTNNPNYAVDEHN
jgi:hypothetical protein